MKKSLFTVLALCLIILSSFTLALAGGEADLFNRMLPPEKIQSLTSSPAKFCDGAVPDALLGNYAGKGDQNVAFSLMKVDGKLVMVYAYDYKGINASVLGGSFKADGDKVIFDSDSGKLTILFEDGGAFVRYSGYNLLKTQVVKIN